MGYNGSFDYCGNNLAPIVNQQIGSAFRTVKDVHDNLASILLLTTNITALVALANELAMQQGGMLGGTSQSTWDEFTFAASGSPVQPGTYYVTNTGLTAGIPLVTVGGDLLFIDKTGVVDPAFSFSGSAVNPIVLTDILPRGGSVALRWSVLYSGYIVI